MSLVRLIIMGICSVSVSLCASEDLLAGALEGHLRMTTKSMRQKAFSQDKELLQKKILDAQSALDTHQNEVIKRRLRILLAQFKAAS